MKKISTSIKTLLFVFFFISFNHSLKSQCNASFIYSTFPSANGVYSFTSTSTTANSITTVYYWTFGSSTFSATGNAGMFPNYTFTANGTYTVNLFILSSAPSCSSMATSVITVTNVGAGPCNLGASFTRTLGTGGQLFCTNHSQGTLSSTTFTWDFGDGNTSNAFSPVHTYTNNGSYMVTLYADNNFTYSCTGVVQAISIVTTAVCNMTANFSSSIGSNGNVSFSNTSTGTSLSTYYTWNFGDGSSVSHVANPSHAFANGTYTVLLTMSNSSVSPVCSDTAAHVVTISNTCVATANFSMLPTNTAQLWNVIPSISGGSIAAVQWLWGDGSSSSTLYTSHQYSAAGMYTICLGVTLTCGSSTVACSSYSVYRSASSNSSNQIIQVNVIDASSVGIQNQTNNLDGKIFIYPNPSSGMFNIQLNGLGEEKITIEVYNFIGQFVSKFEEQYLSGSINKTIDLTEVPNGIYFVKVSQGTQSTITKISVQK